MLADLVGIFVIEVHASFRFEFLVFCSEVRSSHLDSRQSVFLSAETSTAGETVVVHVVSRTDNRKLVLVPEIIGKQFSAIPVFGAIRPVHVSEEPVIHPRFHGQVEHRLFLAVFDTRHTRHIRLFIIGLYLVDDVYRKVFHGYVGVVSKEFFAVNHDFRDFLSVYGDFPTFIHLCPRQFLHQFFQSRTFGHTVCRGVVYQRICLGCYFGCLGYDCCRVQHYGIYTHFHRPDIQVWLRIRYRNFLFYRCISDKRYSQHVVSRTHMNGKTSVQISRLPCNHCTVGQ